MLLAGMFGVCLLHGVIAASVNAFLADATAFIMLVIGVYALVRSGFSSLVV